LADAHRASANPLRIRIVKNYDLVVGRKPKVAFDARAFLKRGGKGKQAVFRKVGAAMQAAMRESRWPRVERVSP
jgi:hypothetical protein